MSELEKKIEKMEYFEDVYEDYYEKGEGFLKKERKMQEKQFKKYIKNNKIIPLYKIWPGR
jgi:hypothetical protein